MVAFLAGVAGAAVELTVGRKEGFQEPVAPSWLKNYDLKNNPIDNPIKGAFGGDHRLYTHGHDVARFLETVRLLMSGKAVGINATTGASEPLQSDLLCWTNMNWQDAAIATALHLVKDFCTKRSIPLPGSSYLASVNEGKFPEWLKNSYTGNELNSRTEAAKGLSLVIPEIINGVYIWQRYESSDNELVMHKKKSLLLLSHSIVSAVSVGKAVALENPFSVNYASVLRVCYLAANVLAQETKFTNNAKIKTELNLLDLSLEVQKTYVMTDVLIQESNSTDELVRRLKKSGS